jgi:hypothetical protein
MPDILIFYNKLITSEILLKNKISIKIYRNCNASINQSKINYEESMNFAN